MSDHLTVSPYLCQAPRDYRDFLNEQIARLETERQRISDQLAMLRGSGSGSPSGNDLNAPAPFTALCD